MILLQDVHGQDKAFGLGFEKDIVLLYSFVNNESHFDLIVKEKEMRTQALVQCQLFCLFLQIMSRYISLSLILSHSLAYVYKSFLTRFLKEEDIDEGLQKMMRDKMYSTFKSQRKKMSRGFLNNECLAKDTLALPPFPYKIAKALDAGFYRNVLFETAFHEKKKVQGECFERFPSQATKRKESFKKFSRADYCSSSSVANSGQR